MKKSCKGRNQAKRLGCNTLVFLNPMHKGLCSKCWIDFLIHNEEGNLYLAKISIKAKKEVKQKQAKQTSQAKKELLSVDGYRAKYLQPKINQIVRLIDYGQPCIATGTTIGKMNAGHCITTGASRTLSLNLHNIHIQSFHSNHHKSGDELKYMEGIIKTYGLKYWEFMRSLHQINIKFAKHELVDAYENAKKIFNELNQAKQTYTPSERIELREQLNKEIGLFK